MSETWAESPELVVTEDLVTTLIERAGYTHPLFNPSEQARAEQGGPPLPGQGVLLLMGGLVEQSGLLDHAIALVELRRVRFHQLLKAGSTLKVRIEPTDARTTSSGKVVQDFRWTGVDAAGRTIAEVEAVMLMNPTGKAAAA